MTNESETNESKTNEPNLNESPTTSARTMRPDLLKFPGLALICLYLMALAGVIILGVAGRHYPPLFLIFAASFTSASAGLLMMFRWAWALALAAVVLLVVYNLWIFSSLHQGAALVQGLFNLIFFLYLVRPEIRERLR